MRQQLFRTRKVGTSFRTYYSKALKYEKMALGPQLHRPRPPPLLRSERTSVTQIVVFWPLAFDAEGQK